MNYKNLLKISLAATSVMAIVSMQAHATTNCKPVALAFDAADADGAKFVAKYATLAEIANIDISADLKKAIAKGDEQGKIEGELVKFATAAVKAMTKMVAAGKADFDKVADAGGVKQLAEVLDDATGVKGVNTVGRDVSESVAKMIDLLNTLATKAPAEIKTANLEVVAGEIAKNFKANAGNKELIEVLEKMGGGVDIKTIKADADIGAVLVQMVKDASGTPVVQPAFKLDEVKAAHTNWDITSGTSLMDIVAAPKANTKMTEDDLRFAKTLPANQGKVVTLENGMIVVKDTPKVIKEQGEPTDNSQDQSASVKIADMNAHVKAYGANEHTDAQLQTIQQERKDKEAKFTEQQLADQQIALATLQQSRKARKSGK